MSIQEFCETNVITISMQATLQTAAKLMNDRCIGFLVVTNMDCEPTGVITDRDIVIKGVAENLVMDLATVGSVMTERIVSVPENASVATAVQAMREHHVRRLVLKSPDGRVYGVVTQDDLIGRLSRDMRDLNDVCTNQNGTRSRHRGHDFTQMA